MKSTASIDSLPIPPGVPWWRVGVMWLVVVGLGVVVVASFMLMATAVQHADTVVPHGAVREAQPTAAAMEARNHAATPAP